MARKGLVFLVVLVAGGCGGSGASCDAVMCDETCQAQGYRGGLCGQGGCACVGGQDGSVDMGLDNAEAGEAAEDAIAEPPEGEDSAPAGFTPTPGTQAAVDRTAPCTEPNEWRQAPQDATVVQACLPNYNVWAPVVCGGPHPACACDASYCLAGEAAKSVNGGEFCVCLNPCTDQSSGATCGASGERGCIPVDDYSGTQVFICGG